jgi:glycosyltransferase involved in cell wall biosynthesis
MHKELSPDFTISVITPVFNGGNYIHTHFKSICIALANYKFEVIYCDNNSTDNSKLVLANLSRSNPNVIVITCEKQGASNARNACLDVAKGNIIAFVDVDDYVIPNGFEDQIKFALQGRASFAFSLIDSTSPFLYPIWDTEKKLNFWLSFGNQGALSSFVTPKTSVKFRNNLTSSEDWLYVVTVRRQLKAPIALVNSVNRIYDASSGYSSSLATSIIEKNHLTAFGDHYGLRTSAARSLYNFVFRQRVSLKSSRILIRLLWTEYYITTKFLILLFSLVLLKNFKRCR